MPKIMNFSSAENRPLLEMLASVLAPYDFLPANPKRDAPKDHARWTVKPGPTLQAVVSVILNPASAPNSWSIEPIVMLASSYVGRYLRPLRPQPGQAGTSGAGDQEYAQVLRFFPAHLRWQDNAGLEYPTIKGNAGSLGKMREEFVEVYASYMAPILEQLTSPVCVAEFQIRAMTEFKSARLSWEEPRYKVSNEYVSTALLFLEDGQGERGLALLEEVKRNRSSILASKGLAYTERLFGEIDELIPHFRGDVM